MAARTGARERRPSSGAPISDLKGPVQPDYMTRPKHKRTFTGFGAGDIKSVEGKESAFATHSFNRTTANRLTHYSFYPRATTCRVEKISSSELQEQG